MILEPLGICFTKIKQHDVANMTFAAGLAIARTVNGPASTNALRYAAHQLDALVTLGDGGRAVALAEDGVFHAQTLEPRTHAHWLMHLAVARVLAKQRQGALDAALLALQVAEITNNFALAAGLNILSITMGKGGAPEQAVVLLRGLLAFEV